MININLSKITQYLRQAFKVLTFKSANFYCRNGCNSRNLLRWVFDDG